MNITIVQKRIDVIENDICSATDLSFDLF